MIVLHRIGPRLSSNWNHLSEIVASEGPLSFDGIYTEVYQHYKALKGRDITFFVSGKYVGSNNSFDTGESPGNFCTWPQIEEMADYLGARIAWHGWAHRRCVDLTMEELVCEMAPPPAYAKIMKVFAWPHGVFDRRALSMAEALGYEDAYCAGHLGDGSKFQRKRSYINW